MAKLEIYAISIIGALIVFGTLLGGAYFKGRLDESRVVASKQTEADLKELTGALQQAQRLVQGDQTAADAAQAKLQALKKGIDDAVAKFGALPPVVLDARGCERLSDAWRLRWDSVESMSGGSPLRVPDSPSSSVQPGAVPTPH